MLRCIVTCAVLAAFGTPRPIPLQVNKEVNSPSASGEENSEWENNNVGAEQSVEVLDPEQEARKRGGYEASPESDPPFKFPWTGSVSDWTYYSLWGWPLGTYPPPGDDYDYYAMSKNAKRASFDDPEWAEDMLAHQIYELGYTTPAWFRPDAARKILMPMMGKEARCSMFQSKHGRVADFIGRVMADINLNFWLMDLYSELKKPDKEAL